jgi:hypothetical protein
MNCITGAVKDFVSYFHSGAKGERFCLAVPERFQSACLAIVLEQARTL